MRCLRRRLGLLSTILVLLSVAAGVPARAAAPAVALSSTAGPPTSTVTVTGNGFGANELVDLYAGTAPVALAVTDAVGAFTSAGFTIPASARPGAFWVTAAGRRTGLAAQTSFTVRVNWTQYGMAVTHGSANRYENVIDTDTARDLDVYWHGSTPVYYGGAAINNGTVYVGTNSGLSAITTAGTPKWSTPFANAVITVPAATNKTIYITTGGDAVAVDALTGAIRWTRTLDAVFALKTPVLVGTTLYVGTPSAVYALNTGNGTIRWTRAESEGVATTPAYFDGDLVYQTNSGSLVSLATADHTENWRISAGPLASYSSPAIANGVVYLGTTNGTLAAYSLRSGGLMWDYTPDLGVATSPAVVRGSVYATDGAGAVFALNARTGALLWSHDDTSYPAGTLAVADGVVFATGGYDVLAYAAGSGTLLWSFALHSYSSGAVAVADGTVYVVGGWLYAFTPDGEAVTPAKRPAVSALR